MRASKRAIARAPSDRRPIAVASARKRSSVSAIVPQMSS
jgi:hypothetical protein